MGQSQSQSSVGDGCEDCYPGGYAGGGGGHGPWQAGYGQGGRLPGSAGVDGVGAGRGTGLGPGGGRGYGPGSPGYGRPGAPGFDDTSGLSQGQQMRPGSLAQRPVTTGVEGPGYMGIPGVPPGRGIGGVGGYGTDGTGTAGGPGYRRPTGVTGIQPGTPGYVGPTGTGYGHQPGAPGYRGPGVAGHGIPTAGGGVTRPGHGGAYPGRPGYVPSTGTQHGGYGQVPSGTGGVTRPHGSSGHLAPGEGAGVGPGGMIQPGAGYPTGSGQQLPDGVPSAHGGQHLGPGMIQRPVGTHDYGAPGYGTHIGVGDGRHPGGGRMPIGGVGGRVPSGFGGQTVPQGGQMVPSGHGVPGHGLYGPGTGRGTTGYGTYPGAVPGRGIQDGRLHHVPSGGGAPVGVPGHLGVPGGHAGIPGHTGIQGVHPSGSGVGIPGGQVGVPGHAGVQGAHVPTGYIPGGSGVHGVPGQVGVPGGYHRPGVDGVGAGYPGVHPGTHGVPQGYDRYPSGVTGHGLTAPGGAGQFRGPGGVGLPGHLAPEGIRAPGTGIDGRYPDGGQLRPGQAILGTGLAPGHGIGTVQRPDGSLVGVDQYGRPGVTGYPGGQRPGYGIDGQYGPGYYDGQAYPLSRPGTGVGGRVPVGGGPDGGESQAQSSVTQDDKEIKAGASSQGRLGDGKAQAQVSGSYSGTGSFSAQAQTSDNGRSAQSQVTGNKDGGSSSAQGNGGKGQSQAQVQLSSANGATKAEAQSGGWQYGSNTQVQAGENGGMADAQSSGPGTTSSQAQVGFKPYRANGNVQRTPFRGGGTASAQSSSYSGQSQSQVQGAYRYGVSFTGAAQAGSGTRGSRGIGNNRNGTRFERDDHAALSPDTFKLKPLNNFGDLSTPSQSEGQDGRKVPESQVNQMNGNLGGRHQGGMDNSGIHSSNAGGIHQNGHGSNGHVSNVHGSNAHGSNGHRPNGHGSSAHGSNGHGANENSHFNGMHVPPSRGQINGQRGQQTHNGHQQYNGNSHGIQSPHSNGHQQVHSLNQNVHAPLQGQETSTEMAGHKTSQHDHSVNGNRQPENEYPRFDNGDSRSQQHGGMQGVDYSRDISQTGGKPAVFKTESPRQSQAVFISPMGNEDVHITQAADGGGIPAHPVYQPGQVVPGSSGYVIPEGFRGRVITDSRSIAGDETIAVASPNNGNSQSQTVVLTPGSGKVNYTRIVRPPPGQPVEPAFQDYGQNQNVDEESEMAMRGDTHNFGSNVYRRGDQHVYVKNKMHTRSGGESSSSNQKVDDYDEEDEDEVEEEEEEDEEEVQASSTPLPANTYVSVTNSVSGQLNPQGGGGRLYTNGNVGNRGSEGGKFAHTYYTKSSTCGYFTFSCNVVFGSNGRAKICKPRPPTNPDGSPCCC
ncbi:hypothetical protein J437_LFUL013902 [Ladona fulva]|nr:hypothetical protein J437_LFUL013902 [Ladona fulva]